MTDEQRHGADTSRGDWERLAPARLTPGGPGSTDVVGWLTRGGVVLVALAAAWLVFCAVRPLPVPGRAGAPAIRPARPIEPPEITVAQRQKLLDSVMTTNWFSPTHQMWTHQDITDQMAVQSKKPTKTAQRQTSKADESATSNDPEAANGLLNTTSPDKLPDVLAKAYANLDLRGIRMRADGRLVAMLTTVQSPTRPATTPCAIGDSFTDEKFPDEAWKIVLIDATNDRVYLRRAGNTVQLPLWKSGGLTVAKVDGENAAAPKGPSRDEIIAQLRAAGISEADIAETLRMAESTDDAKKPPPKPTDVQSLKAATERIEKSSVPDDVKGVADVLKMMSSKNTGPRPNRRYLSFPDVDTYKDTGAGHFVGSSDPGAGVVTLDDGSRWSLSADALKKITAWGATPVIVLRGRGTSQPYVIVNTRTKDYAEVSHIVETPKDAGSADGNVESADAGAGSGG